MQRDNGALFPGLRRRETSAPSGASCTSPRSSARSSPSRSARWRQRWLRPLLLVIQTPAELIGYASEYLRIIFAGFLATYAYNLCASALRSAGDTAASLCFLAVFHRRPTWG